MQKGQVRIIAGKWRSRRLMVPAVPGVRPTPDRVRETLFNWLAPILPGARCLDLFAGTGVLGFEALSRGAAWVEMVDQSAVVVEALQAAQTEFGAENVRIYRASVPNQLQTPAQPFDIVFLDPPYGENLLMPCCEYLDTHGFLASDAYVYLEAKQVIQESDLPAGWQLVKSGKAGQVYYHLTLVKRRHCEEPAS